MDHRLAIGLVAAAEIEPDLGDGSDALGVERADGEGMDAALSARASRKAPGRGAKALRRFWQYLAIGDYICHMIVQRSMADTPPQPPAA